MSIPEDKLMEKLQTGRTEIFFKKINGSIRHMICTLNPKLAPRILLVKEQNTSQGVIAVWDLEKHNWRSFRKDSVISMRDEEI